MKIIYQQKILAAFILVWSLGSTNLFAQQESPSTEPFNIGSTFTPEVLSIHEVKTLITEIESN